MDSKYSSLWTRAVAALSNVIKENPGGGRANNKLFNRKILVNLYVTQNRYLHLSICFGIPTSLLSLN